MISRLFSNSHLTPTGMFDKDGSDTVDLDEFGHLFNYVNAWISTFQKFDSNKSSSIDSGELQQGKCACIHLLTFCFCASLISKMLALGLKSSVI